MVDHEKRSANCRRKLWNYYDYSYDGSYRRLYFCITVNNDIMKNLFSQWKGFQNIIVRSNTDFWNCCYYAQNI